MYQIGDRVEIVAGEYAGLGGEIVAIYPGGYDVLVGGYRLPVVAHDLAPEMRMVAQEALDELRRLGGDARVIARLSAALTR
jgi:ribosomal protein L24